MNKSPEYIFIGSDWVQIGERAYIECGLIELEGMSAYTRADKSDEKDREIEVLHAAKRSMQEEVLALSRRLEKAEAVIDRMLSHAKVLVNISKDSWSICRGSDIIACARDYLSGVKGEKI